MELSQFTDYSLRALMYLAADRERRVMVSEIADAYMISRHHLIKVVNRLGKLGYVQTHRGRGGGITLAMEPEDISVGGVIRQTENLAPVPCLSTSEFGCVIAGQCGLQPALARAQEAFLETLDPLTIADVVPSPPMLRRALGISPAQPCSTESVQL